MSKSSEPRLARNLAWQKEEEHSSLTTLREKLAKIGLLGGGVLEK
jgi:hypothetical protein